MCVYVCTYMNLKTSSWPWAKMSNEKKKLRAPLAIKQNYNSSKAKQTSRCCWESDTNRERETERMRATRVMALAVTTSDLVGIWQRGGECIAQSIQWKSVCDWCASLFLCHTQYECYTKCIFQTILTHSINLRRGETRRCDAMQGEESGEKKSANTCC